MSSRLNPIMQAIRSMFSAALGHTRATVTHASRAAADGVEARRKPLLLLGTVAAVGYLAVTHPPLQAVKNGEVGVRINQFTGHASPLPEGMAWVLPGVHELRRYSLQDQVYRPLQSIKATGEAPFQSVEGLSLGVDLSIRYALDPAKLASRSKAMPQNIGRELVEPQVSGVIYQAFTSYTVREIFSTKRAEIGQKIEAALKPKLAQEGIILKGVLMGQVDLPADYKRGMEKLLAEELASEKMRFTLELKDKQVKQTALEAEAEKIRREKAAEAAGNEAIIAARAQEEAMKHVLPFKQKQIEQRRFEAEAEKTARIKTSEGAAQARIIEAAGEADSRRKLADAEAYRQDLVGKVASSQLERDGALLTRHPLLIQKAMADKLSDKVSVIIAPPPADGGFIGAALLGSRRGNEGRMVKTALDGSDAPLPDQAEGQNQGENGNNNNNNSNNNGEGK